MMHRPVSAISAVPVSLAPRFHEAASVAPAPARFPALPRLTLRRPALRAESDLVMLGALCAVAIAAGGFGLASGWFGALPPGGATLESVSAHLPVQIHQN
ncbi:hypothetical protein KM176_08775 [Pseudooceanicola sp. CBS1P-1]|uniref:Uncharacterized protein n=1 Tax=Pseudooceanicola albus TaxID=2692189 RepID=A0A6L7FZA4_9RHOB|nr:MULTISPECIES: hypothetical protein [Pseudooceanicola]MBT9383947.1 hypothetical protein [Pseudooceanicola endophyticus]MXN16640.1 hypothetical protein [Pseudooceanicola albus]